MIIFNNSGIIFQSHNLDNTIFKIIPRNSGIIHCYINNNRTKVYEIEAKQDYENSMKELVEAITFVSFKRLLSIKLIANVLEVYNRIVMLKCKSVNLNCQSEVHKELCQHYVLFFCFKNISDVSLGHYSC